MNNYFKNDKYWGFNCFILKKEIFNELCEFQFPILFEIEKQIDVSEYNYTMKRTVGFLGEILFGIFIYHKIITENKEYQELPIIFYNDTRIFKRKTDYYKLVLLNKIDIFLRSIFDLFFPIGSKKRENIKKILKNNKNIKENNNVKY